MTKIILATISPRRRQIMRLTGLPFKAVASGYREVHHKHLSPSELVKFLATGKAQSAAKKFSKSIIIGADTVVEFNGKIYGKPKDKNEARKMLKMISGKKHLVFTGVCVMNGKTGKRLQKVVVSKVYFRKLTSAGIENYIKNGEPMDKACAYEVQGLGAGFVKQVEGDFTNVVGLPLDEVMAMLKRVSK